MPFCIKRHQFCNLIVPLVNKQHKFMPLLNLAALNLMPFFSFFLFFFPFFFYAALIYVVFILNGNNCVICAACNKRHKFMPLSNSKALKLWFIGV
jgi:hypothetical protein